MCLEEKKTASKRGPLCRELEESWVWREGTQHVCRCRNAPPLRREETQLLPTPL